MIFKKSIIVLIYLFSFANIGYGLDCEAGEVDNEVLVDAKKFYLKKGEFVNIKITEATDYDLIGVPVTI